MPATVRSVILAAVGAAVVLSGCGVGGSEPVGAVGSSAPDPAETTTIVAAGDIACQPGWPGYNDGKGRGKVCRQLATAQAAESQRPDAVLVLGDVQYEDGDYVDYVRSFDQSWGQRFLNRDDPSANRMWPVPGNHSYRDDLAAGYFAYFNGGTPERPNPTGIAGTTNDGWYRHELPGWTVLALNANCVYLKDGCRADSEQYEWLREQLQNTQSCTLAFWHEPLFNRGKEPAARSIRPFWKLLAAAKADVILNGHDHTYQRFPRLDPQGRRDPEGIQQIIIGNGGKNLTGFARKTSQPAVVTKNNTTLGVLSMELMPGEYTWEFVRAPFPGNGRYSDSGSSRCV